MVAGSSQSQRALLKKRETARSDRFDPSGCWTPMKKSSAVNELLVPVVPPVCAHADAAANVAAKKPAAAAKTVRGGRMVTDVSWPRRVCKGSACSPQSPYQQYGPLPVRAGAGGAGMAIRSRDACQFGSKVGRGFLPRSTGAKASGAVALRELVEVAVWVEADGPHAGGVLARGLVHAPRPARPPETSQRALIQHLGRGRADARGARVARAARERPQSAGARAAPPGAREN